MMLLIITIKCKRREQVEHIKKKKMSSSWYLEKPFTGKTTFSVRNVVVHARLEVAGKPKTLDAVTFVLSVVLFIAHICPTLFA